MKLLYKNFLQFHYKIIIDIIKNQETIIFKKFLDSFYIYIKLDKLHSSYLKQ